MRTDATRVVESEPLWATVAALVLAGAAGLASGSFVGVERFWPPFSSTDGALALASIVAAAVVGWSTWMVVARYVTLRPVRHGAAVGLVTGMVAHPVMWFLWPLIPPTQGMAWSAPLMPLMSIWSLLFVGWITVPLAVVAGAGVGAVRAAVTRLGPRREASN